MMNTIEYIYKANTIQARINSPLTEKKIEVNSDIPQGDSLGPPTI